MIAEMSVNPLLPSGDITLQWGRDQMIAEISGGWGRSYRLCTASMGPRSDDRGNFHLPAAFHAGALLQWGRDQMIAEMVWADAYRLRVSRLQWGRDQMIAEIYRLVESGTGLGRAQMVPR